jgi:hypothetical protein
MKQLVIACAVLALACSAGWSGVVIEMEVAEAGSSGEAATDTIYTQGKMVRMDPHPTKGSDDMSVLFRDETLWMIDHKKKVCQKIDKEGMKEVGEQLGSAMKEMEAQLAELPPEQRAMMEKMMKGKMSAGAGMGEAPPRRIETGGTEQVGEYSCTVHTLYSGDEKVWAVCAAEESAVGPVAEAKEAFGAMSEFAEQLREIMKQLPFAGMIDTPFNDMNELDGFPVRVRTYRKGKLASETTLKSVNRQDLADDVFAVPDKYKVKNLADQAKKKR